MEPEHPQHSGTELGETPHRHRTQVPSTKAEVRAMGIEPIAARLTAARLRLGAQLPLAVRTVMCDNPPGRSAGSQCQRTRTQPVPRGAHAVQLDYAQPVQLRDSEARHVLSVEATAAPPREQQLSGSHSWRLKGEVSTQNSLQGSKRGYPSHHLRRPRNARDILINTC